MARYESVTIVEEVYEKLKHDILNLSIKPGEPLTEQKISNKYGISRTPCRDVFQKLRSIGLIENIPFKGNYVSLLNLDNINQMIYMRIIIECKVISDVISIDDEKFIVELEYNLKLQEILLKSEFGIDEFSLLDENFHKLWFKATNKLFIWEQIQNSRTDYKRFRMLDIEVERNFQAIYENHKELVQIIKDKKIDQIEDSVIKHLHSGINRLGDKIYNEYAQYFVDRNK